MKKHLLPLKKLITLSTVFISSFAFSQVTSFPWTEGFEDTSPTVSQWTYEYISGTNTSTTNNVFWTVRTTASVGYGSANGPKTGSKLLDFDPRSFSSHTGRYISPILDLSSSNNPTLTFFYRNRIWGSDQNVLKIYYRTSSTAPWTLIQTLDTNINDWTTSPTITLPSPSATYQIALEGIAAYGYSINIDDLTVTTGLLSVSETQTSKSLRVYPNPAKDVLNIKSEMPISEFSIFDTNGKSVIKQKENTQSVDVHNLNKGLYILQTKDKNGNVATQKFIKE